MGRFLLTLVVGLGLFSVVAWHLDLLPSGDGPTSPTNRSKNVKEPPKLGGFLYKPAPLAEESFPVNLRGADPIVVAGHFSVMDKLDAPSQLDGQLLFIGQMVPEGAAQVAGLAPFMSEPHHYATVQQGGRDLIVLYRRLIQDQVVGEEEMVAMLDPARALDELITKKFKIDAAKAELKAAEFTYKEADSREKRARPLRQQGVMSAEEYNGIVLTRDRHFFESISKEQAVKSAEIEAEQVARFLKQHEIRNKIPVSHSIIKTIYRNRGEAVKNLEPVMTLYSLERLWAEALVDVHFRLYEGMKVTLEPTREEPPMRTLKGHRGEITSVAVSNAAAQPYIVSASEDRTVCVWRQNSPAPLMVFPHPEVVRVVACSPNQTICLSGGNDGHIRFWDLEEPALLAEARTAAAKDQKDLIEVLDDWIVQAQKAEDTARESALSRARSFLLRQPFKDVTAHSDAVTALAFTPDGEYLASGGADGAIKLWQTADGKLVYAFDWEHGATNPHQGAITALQFTPQCRLVSASRDNTIRVWLVMEKGARLEFDPILDRSGNVAQLGVRPDGRYLLYDQAKELQFLAVNDGRSLATLKNPAGAIPFETLAMFSPDGNLLLTAGASEGRLQLWKAPMPGTRGFEVRQYVTEERATVTCAAFAAKAGQGGDGSFAVSGTKDGYLYLWPVPTKEESAGHRLQDLRLTRIGQAVDANNRQVPLGVEVPNLDGRFKPGRPVTIVFGE